MKNLMILIGTLVSFSSAFASECQVDGMKTLSGANSLKRGEIVAEVILKKEIMAPAGSSEITLVNAADGTSATVHFREALTQDLVLAAKSPLRLFAISDRADNQEKHMNCGKDSGTCLHVDHPLVDTIAFKNAMVGLKQLQKAGVAVCIM